MELSGAQLTSPIEGWGENLHRLLEERATSAGYEGPKGPNDTTRRSRQEDSASSIAPDTSTRSGKESRRDSISIRVPRVLPARPTGDRFPAIASAFDIYTEPDLPAAPTAFRERSNVLSLEAQLYVESAPTSRPSTFASYGGPPTDSNDLTQWKPATAEATRMRSLVESSIDRIGPHVTYARDDSAKDSISRIHPSTSMASISSEETGEPGLSSGPSSTAYEESTRSLQFTPPASSAHSPPLSAKRPALNTSYTRPMGQEGVPTQTPLVEAGPSWGPEVSKSPHKSAPSLSYRNPSSTQLSSQPEISPTKRRTHSYYAFADAKSDRILSLPPHLPINDALSSGQNSTPSTTPFERDMRSSVSSTLSTSPPRRHTEPAASFQIESEDPNISAFACEQESTAETTSYSAYHILPEDHTDRIRSSAERNTSPVRRKPVPKSPTLPKKGITDTFKEAVSELAPGHDSLKEVKALSTRPRHVSDSSYGSFYSDMDDQAAQTAADFKVTSHEEIPKIFANEDYQFVNRNADSSQRGPSINHQPVTYIGTSKEITSIAPLSPKPVMEVPMAPSTEPRSHLEMIRQRNMERKRGKRNQLRIVNT